jgi:hypothetical protein
MWPFSQYPTDMSDYLRYFLTGVCLFVIIKTVLVVWRIGRAAEQWERITWEREQDKRRNNNT